MAIIFQKLYFRSGNVKGKLQSWNGKSQTETTNVKVKESESGMKCEIGAVRESIFAIARGRPAG